MLKPFQELIKIDVLPFCQQRQIAGKTLDYLPWQKCLTLLYEHGASVVKFNFEQNESGYPAFYSPDNDHPFVRVAVQIDDDRFVYDYPVINGEFSISKPVSLDIHTAQQRCLVKAIAIHTGLGLSLWDKEEEEVPFVKDDGLNLQLTIKLGEKVSKFGTPEAVLSQLNATKKDLDTLIKSGDVEAKRTMIEKIMAL